MFKQLLKRPLFWFGFIYIVGWLIASLLYMWIGHNHIPLGHLTYNAAGKIIERSPYSPIEHPPLGTDAFGRDVFAIMLIGAKFTLGICILIALLRVILASVLGVGLRLYIPRIGRAILTPLENMSYFPITLLAFFFLKWVLLDDGNGGIHDNGFTYSFWVRTWIDMAFLTVLALPTTTQAIFNETGNILSKDFIDSARVLGGGKFHLFWKHIKPYLTPQFLLILTREFIQVLLVLAHLSILNIVMGGSVVRETLLKGLALPYTPTNEWSSLIGSWWHFVWSSYPWLPYIPIIAVTLSIMSAKAILICMEDIIEKGPVQEAESHQTEPEKDYKEMTLTDDLFLPIKEERAL